MAYGKKTDPGKKAVVVKKNTTKSVPVNSAKGQAGLKALRDQQDKDAKLIKSGAKTPAGPKYTKTSVAVKNDMDKRKALGKRPS